jgi:VWFA-related protein
MMTARRGVTRCTVMIALLIAPIEGQQRFTSRAEAVRVDVLITDGTRRVGNLTADDFEVRDNGVVQRVTQIDVEHLMPVNVICVFDASASVAGARLRELVSAGRALIDRLRDIDRIAVVSFATHVGLPLRLTTEHDRARDAIAGLSAAGQTALRDATFAGLALRDADQTRTLLLIFSDGDDTASWLAAPRVLESARRTDAVVYAVRASDPEAILLNGPTFPGSRYGQPTGTLRPPPSAPPDQHAKFLDLVTAETGGRVFRLDTDKDLTKAFTAILGEFRDRYVLSYTPIGVDTPGWHELSVRVKGKSVKVTARRGYFAQ